MNDLEWIEDETGKLTASSSNGIYSIEKTGEMYLLIARNLVTGSTMFIHQDTQSECCLAATQYDDDTSRLVYRKKWGIK